jgi:hypothetical protein
MKDRLIGLIREAKKNTKGANCDLEREMLFADYLLANGIIVPPCNVGDTVYYVHETYWDEDYENYITTEKYKQSILQVVDRPNHETNLMLEIKEFDYTLIDSNVTDNEFTCKYRNGDIYASSGAYRGYGGSGFRSALCKPT